jgi:anaerobic selenocysteine-containing dehydrogenase
MERQNHVAGVQSVYIHASDAAARGIVEGSLVRVYNDRGEASAVAIHSADVMRGLVVMPMGYWLDADQSGTVNALNSGRFADYGGAPTFSDTSVEIELKHAERPAETRKEQLAV